MKTLRLAAPAAVAGIIMMSTGAVAHAAVDPYPVATPKPSIAPDNAAVPDKDDAIGPDNNGILPSTGGASVYILLAGGALLVVGGGVVYSSRRRETAAH